jgi:hypothetical protein
MFLPRGFSGRKESSMAFCSAFGTFIVILQVAGYFFVRGRPDFADRLVLDPAAVLDGELWRLVTFIAIPLSDSFLMFFILWFLYYIFKTLRSEWGDFKFSLYFFLAWFGAVLGAFLFNARVENLFSLKVPSFSLLRLCCLTMKSCFFSFCL